MMETGNPNLATFLGLSILVKTQGYIADGRCAPRSMWPAAPSKPTPQFGHAEPSTDQIPCADLVPGSGQRQSRAVLPEHACFCLPATSFLSCDQTDSPCRPSRLTYSRCFEGRSIWNGEGGTASREAWLPSHVTRSRGSLRCSAGVDVLKDIAEVCPTSTFFLRRKRRPSCIIPSPE